MRSWYYHVMRGLLPTVNADAELVLACNRCEVGSAERTWYPAITDQDVRLTLCAKYGSSCENCGSSLCTTMCGLMAQSGDVQMTQRL